MQTERNYDFRKRLLQIHRKDLRDAAILPNENELVLDDGWWIVMPANADEITETAAKDFQDYLYTSMNLSAMVTRCAEKTTGQRIILAINPDLGEHSISRGYRITIEDEVRVEGFDSKGIAQGLYHLEDVMNLRLAPYLPRGIHAHHPLLGYRATMSGYGADMYPDAYLARLAHLGITTITGIHAKEYFLVLNRYEAPRDRQELRDCADEMERILMAERENAAATIPLVEFDSILGFEPSMEYVCDRAALEWKLRQVDYELEWGPPGLRRTECNM